MQRQTPLRCKIEEARPKTKSEDEKLSTETGQVQAEFPHLWSKLEKFIGGKTEYDDSSLGVLLGKDWRKHADDLSAVGFLAKRRVKDREIYMIPRLYRHSMEVTQGKA